MLRIRTMYGDSLKFSAENLSFAYGLNGNTSYTEYGYAKGYTGTATFSGASYYYLSSAGANQTNSATINFVTTNANQQVSFYIGSQSEANYLRGRGVSTREHLVESALRRIRLLVVAEPESVGEFIDKVRH